MTVSLNTLYAQNQWILFNFSVGMDALVGEIEVTAVSLLLSASYYLLLSDSEDDEEPPVGKRSVWVREWLEKREQEGAYAKLLVELRYGDSGEQKLFQNFLRMSHSDFDYLLQLVKPLIEKSDTPMRRAIPAGERLAVTLHYLATGQSFRSLQFVFRLPQNTISTIIPPVLDAIWTVLKDEFVRVKNFCLISLYKLRIYIVYSLCTFCTDAVDGS